MKKIYKTTIVFLVLDIVFVALIFLINGPLCNNLINKLYNSKIVYSLWDSDTVWQNLVGTSNYLYGSDVIKEIKNEEVINQYEKEILTKDKNNENYKLINLKIDGYPAYMVVIYDPTKIELVHTKTFDTGTSQENIMSMCKRYKGTICINGGKFVDYGVGSDTPVGYLIDDGKVIWPKDGNDTKKGKIIGFTDKGRLTLMNTSAKEAIAAGVKEALQFGPFLIVDGVEQKLSDYAIGGFMGASRVAVAQREDGIVLFLVADGNHGAGATIKSMISTFKKYGAYNAANLDGGASSQLVIKGKLINNPKNIYGESMGDGRKVVSGFGVVFD